MDINLNVIKTTTTRRPRGQMRSGRPHAVSFEGDRIKAEPRTHPRPAFYRTILVLLGPRHLQEVPGLAHFIGCMGEKSQKRGKNYSKVLKRTDEIFATGELTFFFSHSAAD